MRKLSIAIVFALLLITMPTRAQVPAEHDIEIIITSDMSQDVLTQVLAESKTQGITIEFTEIIFTDDGHITKVQGTVVFEDCGSGSFESDDNFSRLRLHRDLDGNNCGIRVG